MSPLGVLLNTAIHSINNFEMPVWRTGLKLRQWLYHEVVTSLLLQRMDAQQMHLIACRDKWMSSAVKGYRKDEKWAKVIAHGVPAYAFGENIEALH